jgi:hypothetical protein
VALRRWKIKGIRNRRHLCSSVKVACGHARGHRLLQLLPATSSLLRACPRSRTIQSIIAIWGFLTLHLSVVRLLVVARPRPSKQYARRTSELCKVTRTSKPSQPFYESLRNRRRFTETHRIVFIDNLHAGRIGTFVAAKD